MNRQGRRALRSAQHRHVSQLPSVLTPVPESEFPPIQPRPIKVWRSRKYLVQLYDESTATYPGMMRLSILRATMKPDGRWEDGLTWDELQGIKREIGFGDMYAVEVYPRDADLINVANIRHLWLLPMPLEIGWVKR